MKYEEKMQGLERGKAIQKAMKLADKNSIPFYVFKIEYPKGEVEFSIGKAKEKKLSRHQKNRGGKITEITEHKPYYDGLWRR